MKIRYICIAIFLFLSPLSLVSAETSVTLQLQWHHQFQFAGYYAAKEKGFYQQAGLNITILEGENPPHQEVASGEAEFGISSTGLISEAAHNQPLVALAAINQVSQYVWLVLANSDIYTAKDFIGKTITHQEANDSLTAMFIKEGIALEHINIIDPSFDIEQLINGDVDALSAYASNEPFAMFERGIDYRIISPEQYGIDFYGDILFTSQAMIDKHPETVSAFREATLAGWKYAIEHQEEIIDLILHKYNSQNKSRQHLLFEAKAIADSTLYPIVELGHMNKGRWQHIARTYKEIGVINSAVDLNTFLYSSYLKADHRRLYLGLFIASLLILIITAVAFRFAKLSAELDRLLYLKSQYANIGESVNNITHQWKQPLNELGIQLMLIESELDNTPSDQKSIRRLNQKSHHILQFMADTVDLFRFFLKTNNEIIHFSPVDVITSTSLLLSDNLRLNRIQFEQTISDTQQIKGNNIEFAHVVLSILVNARDILVERKIKTPKIMVGLSSDSEAIKLTICDNGGGIKAQPISSIFKLGFSQKVSGKSGVGLYIAKKIIEKEMKGKLLAHNTELGACFTIIIPLANSNS
ncbi:MAG: hypothetical protein GQ547_01440 [Methylophaga sp.]|nr:hypothetical protein [Methylophaga sp.]